MIRLVTALARFGFVVAAIAAFVPMIAFAQANEPAIESVPTEAETEEVNASITGDESDTGDDNRFNDLRSELLDDRAAYIDRWLAVIAIVLTFFGIVVAVAGVLGFRRFMEIEAAAKSSVATVTEIAETAKRHLKEIERNRDKSDEILRGMNAETAANNPEEADQAVESIRENPEASPIQKTIGLAVSLQRLGKRDEAIEKWRAVAHVAEGSDNELAARAWFSVGYLLKEENPQSCMAYDEAIRLNPNIAEAYLNRGNTKARVNRHEEAIADYDEAIRLNPDYANAYNNRGNAKCELNRHEEAIADYDEAIRLNPAKTGAYLNRGNAKARLKLKDEARKDFETALGPERNANDANIVARAEQALRDLDDAEGS